MRRAVLLLLFFTLTALSGSAEQERDVGCGPGVYCRDSPDDDGDPCTTQPDDPSTSDYDESSDDVPCKDILTNGIFENVTAPENAAPPVDVKGEPLTWYENPESVDCERVPDWCLELRL